MKTVTRVPAFFVPEPIAEAGTITLGEDAARHLRVLRLGVGAALELLDGQGTRAAGLLRTLAKRNATVDIVDTKTVEALPAVHALVPIADRERMLWLAEKAAELALTTWRPVLWHRSRSVTPRGEGSGFQTKVHARMVFALEQSGGAWLPVTYPDAPPARALAALPEGRRFVLDMAGTPIASALRNLEGLAVTIAVGPEGGLEEEELRSLEDSGFERVSLGPTTLRFETAGVAAIAHARAALAALEGAG